VPGLIHQYSLITSKLNRKISLHETISSLFPGGSITGAPKKKVMEIISETERFQRSFYCGTTVLCYQDKKVASINIRSATINLEERIWQYGAGGGITLLSKAHIEFQEMESKVQSFLSLFRTI
jgi:anthranilate/para-aminobenzoate synthase component I